MKPEEAAASIEWLGLQVAAQERISMAIALTLSATKRAELLENLTALQINAAGVDGRDAALAMQHFIDRFLTLAGKNLGASQNEAKLNLALEAALHASAPAGLKEAKKAWLAIASDEEIADELREMLEQLPPLPGASKKRRKRGSS
ncbi:MAG: hypothetical protein KF796_20705 [Ramlibacter sp.]|nr:hypothetical protein [Ramlibacter sp.]